MTVRRLLLPVLAIAATLVAPLAVATAAGPASAEFVADTNQARTEAGLGGLVPDDRLAAIASRHTERMAARGKIFHNGDLANELTVWDQLGENVGVGASEDAIQREFMASATHRGIILDPSFTHIGVATLRDGEGRLWVTVLFGLPSPARVAAAGPQPPSEGRRATPDATTTPAPRADDVRPSAPAPRELASATVAAAALGTACLALTGQVPLPAAIAVVRAVLDTGAGPAVPARPPGSVR